MMVIDDRAADAKKLASVSVPTTGDGVEGEKAKNLPGFRAQHV